jgi:hypothetical protein
MPADSMKLLNWRLIKMATFFLHAFSRAWLLKNANSITEFCIDMRQSLSKYEKKRSG